MAEAHIIVLHQRTSCARPMAHEMITRSLTFTTARFHAGASSERCTKRTIAFLKSITGLLTHIPARKRWGVGDKLSPPLPPPTNKQNSIHTYTRTHTHTHTNTHTHTRTHARTHARTQTRTHTNTHARTHARTRTHTHNWAGRTAGPGTCETNDTCDCFTMHPTTPQPARHCIPHCSLSPLRRSSAPRVIRTVSLTSTLGNQPAPPSGRHWPWDLGVNTAILPSVSSEKLFGNALPITDDINPSTASWFRSCVRVEVDVLGCPS